MPSGRRSVQPNLPRVAIAVILKVDEVGDVPPHRNRTLAFLEYAQVYKERQRRLGPVLRRFAHHAARRDRRRHNCIGVPSPSSRTRDHTSRDEFASSRSIDQTTLLVAASYTPCDDAHSNTIPGASVSRTTTSRRSTVPWLAIVIGSSVLPCMKYPSG